MQSAVYTGDEDNRHHWAPESQTYSNAANLLHYMRRNWRVDPMSAVETFWLRGGRYVYVYYFTLTREGRRIEMPVLGNPAVFRLIKEHNIRTEQVSGPGSRAVGS